MWRLCLSCGEEKALQGLPISFLDFPPHTQRFCIQAGQLLTEDVTWCLPGHISASYKLVMDHRWEAGAKVTITNPSCAASDSLRGICCLRPHTCKSVLPHHFISDHYGSAAGKRPEVKRVTTCWFPTPFEAATHCQHLGLGRKGQDGAITTESCKVSSSSGERGRARTAKWWPDDS